MAEIPTPEQVALVRRRYRERATVKAISAESGIKNRAIVYRCLAGEFADGSGQELAPIPLRRAGAHSRARAVSRKALVERLWRTAERQVEEIEERLAAAGLQPSEREGNARMLATVVKTLRELSAIDKAHKPRRKEAPNDNDDDPVPRDIDEFRRVLARRIEALIAARTDSGGTGAP
jgi:hypothetical protein